MATEGRVVVRGVVAGTLGCYHTNELGGGTGALVRGPARTELGRPPRDAAPPLPPPPQTAPRNPLPLPPNSSHLHGSTRPIGPAPTHSRTTTPIAGTPDALHSAHHPVDVITSPSSTHRPEVPSAVFRRRSSCGIAHRPAWSPFQHRLSVSVAQAAGSSHPALAERGSIAENGGK